MGKTVAVWGSPGSGKTVFSVKLANAIYETYRSTVIVLFCCLDTPSLPVILPKYKTADIASVGTPLSKTEITAEDVAKSIVMVKNKVNFGFLGYKDGDNRFTYPRYNEEKAYEFLRVIADLADCIIIDCDSNLSGSTLSYIALTEAGTVFRLASPDLKSISWYLSQKAVYSDSIYGWDKQIQVINTPDADVFVPVEEVKSQLKNVAFTVPYSRAVKNQMQDGTLFIKSTDKRFEKKLKAVAGKVVEHGSN